MPYASRHLIRKRRTRSKHWRHRVVAAATVAAGSILLLASAASAKYHWVPPLP